MTRQEQFDAINERLGWKVFDHPGEISVMIIANLLDRLHKKGLVEAPFLITDRGSRVIAIAEEFGWKVTETEMQQFCKEMIPDQVDAFMYLIKAAQDNTLEE